MVNVSKKYLEEKLKESVWKNFRKAVGSTSSNEAFMASIKKFMTSSEIVMLEKRLAIPVLLEQGFSYRSIGEMIDVSPNTISFMKNNFAKKPVVHRRSSNKKSDKSDMEHLISWFPSRSDHGKWLRKI